MLGAFMGAPPASSIPAGVARTIDLAWPGPFSDQQDGGAFPVSLNDRGGAKDNNDGATATAGTGTVGWTEYKGHGCGKLHAPAAVGNLARFAPGRYPSPPLQQPKGSYVDPLRCWRILARMAFAQPTGAIGNMDIGLSLAWQAYVNPNASSIPFVGFYLQNVNDIRLLARATNVAGNPSTNVPVPASIVADPREWHDYELRVIGASAAAAGKVRAFVDGNLLAELALDNVTLPNTWTTTGSAGYPQWLINAINACNGVCTDMYLARLLIQAAPDEPSLS